MKLEVETKYNIGDTVFFLNTGLGIVESEIVEIKVDIQRSKNYYVCPKRYETSTRAAIEYCVDCHSRIKAFPESALYPTRESLLEAINNGEYAEINSARAYKELDLIVEHLTQKEDAE